MEQNPYQSPHTEQERLNPRRFPRIEVSFKRVSYTVLVVFAVFVVFSVVAIASFILHPM